MLAVSVLRSQAAIPAEVLSELYSPCTVSTGDEPRLGYFFFVRWKADSGDRDSHRHKCKLPFVRQEVFESAFAEPSFAHSHRRTFIAETGQAVGIDSKKWSLYNDFRVIKPVGRL